MLPCLLFYSTIFSSHCLFFFCLFLLTSWQWCFQFGKHILGKSWTHGKLGFKFKLLQYFQNDTRWQSRMITSLSMSTAVSTVSNSFLWVQTRDHLWLLYLRLSWIWRFLTWCSLHRWTLDLETVSLSWWKASSTICSESPLWCHVLPRTAPSPTTRYWWCDAVQTLITCNS